MFRQLANLPGLDGFVDTLLSPRSPEPLLACRKLAGCGGTLGRENPVGSSARADYAGPPSGIWMAETPTTPIPHVDPTAAMFRSEYEQEMESWLRQRFRMVCLCYLALAGAVLGLRLWIGFDEGPGRVVAIIATLISSAAAMATVSYFYFSKSWVNATREQLVRSATLMILCLGVISLARNGVIVSATAGEENFLLPLFAWHLVACLLLPWTPRESLRPIVPLLVVWMLGVLLLEQSTIIERGLKIIFAPGVLVPGLCWCALRLRYHSERFRIQMVGKQFFTMRREMAEARTIHENLFPRTHDDGFVRFEYTYTPQRELGGDYVHHHVSPTGATYVTLLDVTGHGLAAALTVNRLYGELERIFGESPDADPVDVLILLNRYIHLTMVKHNIYVTGMCMRVDPTAGKLTWSSAGHPPALLRGVNGVVRKLSATNVLLGALDGSEFRGMQSQMELSPGDAIVMYTDGVYEARDRQGRMLGLDRVDSLAHTQPAPRRWPQFIAAAVQKHSGGRTDDDVLVATVTYLAPRAAQVHGPETPSPLAA